MKKVADASVHESWTTGKRRARGEWKQFSRESAVDDAVNRLFLQR